MLSKDSTVSADFEKKFIRKPGIMSRKIVEFPWEHTPLGDISNWPIYLTLYIAQILNQDIPQLIFWGPDLIPIHNDAYLPYLPEEFQDKTALGIYPNNNWSEDWAIKKEIIDKVFTTGIPFFQKDIQVLEYRKNKPPGFTYWDLGIGPLMNDQGGISGVLIHIIETTEKIRFLNEMEVQERKINLILNSSEIGFFEVNEKTRNFFLSDISKEIFGFTTPPPISQFENLIHPTDRAIRNQAIQDALVSGFFEYTVRLINREPYPWIFIKGQRYFDHDQNTNRVFGIVQDVTKKKLKELELVQSHKKLKIALEKQEILQEQKDEFLQIASHELRSPLTSIKGYGQLVEEVLVEKGFTEEVEMLDKLNSRVEHLHSLVNTLFDVSKINAGKLELNPVDFDLTDLVQSILLDTRISAIPNPIFQNFLPKARVRADKDRITQVVHNILNNAQKYSQPDQEIKVSTIRVGNMVQMEVEDQGLGIPKEDLEKIFGQFYRSRNNPLLIGGLGLGLHLSYQIIKAHGGEIWANSLLGNGSRFYFTLPLIIN